LRVTFCTTEQLNDVACVYIREMQKRGFNIAQAEAAAVVRMAAIQDVWRVAFARVLGS